MPVVRAGDLDVHAQVLGAGPTVVMLHGLLVGSIAEWYFTVAPSLAESRRCLLYDLRGHGRTSRAKAGYGLRSLSKDLRCLLQATETPTPVDLVGHSYGGLVALRHALDHPDQVRSLTLVDVPLPPSTMDARSMTREKVDEILRSLPGSQQESIRKGGRRGRRLLETVQFLLMESSLMTDLKAEPEIRDADLASLVPRALGIFGEGSPCLVAGQRLQRVVPGFELLVLAGGHFLPIESPGPLTEAIAGFLDG